VGGSVTDENGLTTPLNNDILALGDSSKVDLNLGQSQDISGSRHTGKEILDGGLGSSSRDHTESTNNKVGSSTVTVSVTVRLQVGGEVRDLVCRTTDGVRVVKTLLLDY